MRHNLISKTSTNPSLYGVILPRNTEVQSCLYRSSYENGVPLQRYTMRLLALLAVLLGLLSFASATDNGKTTDVTWDQYSLSVKGERVFVFSGEFHYQRLPVPELWLDVFQKLRSNGFNAVSSELLNKTYHRTSRLIQMNSLLFLELPLRLGRYI
jgi:hypothetical protein